MKGRRRTEAQEVAEIEEELVAKEAIVRICARMSAVSAFEFLAEIQHDVARAFANRPANNVNDEDEE